MCSRLEFSTLRCFKRRSNNFKYWSYQYLPRNIISGQIGLFRLTAFTCKWKNQKPHPARHGNGTLWLPTQNTSFRTKYLAFPSSADILMETRATSPSTMSSWDSKVAIQVRCFTQKTWEDSEFTCLPRFCNHAPMAAFKEKGGQCQGQARERVLHSNSDPHSNSGQTRPTAVLGYFEHVAPLSF